MDFLGMYKLFSTMGFKDGKFAEISAEEFNNMPFDCEDEEELRHEKKQRAMIANTIIEVADDNKIYCVMPIPEGVSQEEVDKAVAEGEVTLRGGMMVVEQYDWEERDGEVYYNTRIQGEILGEATDPWAKAFDENGYLVMVVSKYVKQ